MIRRFHQGSALFLGLVLCALLSMAVPMVAHAADAKGLSMFEISIYSPKYHPPDDAFLARLARTGHLKLRLLRKNAQFEVKFGATKLKADWKKVADACTQILGAH